MRPLILFVFALTAACNRYLSVRSDIESDAAPPPAKVYPDEVISITLWKRDGEPGDQVSVLIEPSRTISLRRYNVDWRTNDVETQILDSKRLNQDLFEELRSRLANYRPAELNREGPTVLPKGCGWIWDGSAIINIGFGDDQEQSGSFVLVLSV